MKSLLKGAFNGFDKTLTNAQSVLTGSGDSAFAINDVWDVVLTISEALKPFCMTVIAICLLIELAQVASKVDIIKWEHGLKICVKMVLAKVCIDVAPTFLKACYLQSAEWITSALGTGTYMSMGSLISSEVNNRIDSISGIWANLGLFGSCLILAIAIKICGLLIMVIAFARMFEIYVYLAVSPLPCAFFPLGDGSGGGMSRITMKFFKNFIAVCLQGVMMIVCLRIFSMILTSSLSTFIAADLTAGNATVVVYNLCFTMLMGCITLVVAVSKCGSWAKAIMDAG
ncbi:MAG: hypothetical protein LUC32_07750 [Clostridiales bacterium]|nr:hypothetical protein [Clostridiales bacterium]